jgi:hypothetical protein
VTHVPDHPFLCCALCLLVCMLVQLPAIAAEPGAKIAPGSYCALPEPGEAPACLEPARAKHASFFEAVESGRIDAEATNQLEDVLMRQPGTPDAYLALSSLAYGYMSLAQNAETGSEDSALLEARLERWNALISKSYAEPDSPEHFRGALLEAARDIHARVASLGATCTTGDAGQGECSSGLLAALERVDSEGPIRSPLRRLVDRLRGTESSP